MVVELQTALCRGQDVITVLSSRASRQLEAAEELAATKEANARLEAKVARLKEALASDKKALVEARKSVRVARAKRALAEEKLESAKLERGTLVSTLARRDHFFAQKGAEGSSFLSTSLAKVSAHVPPFEIMEDGNAETTSSPSWRLNSRPCRALSRKVARLLHSLAPRPP